MIALCSTLLYHGVLARGLGRGKRNAFERLPIEVLDNILLFSGASSLATRNAIQLVSRQFRCIVVLNTNFLRDLASLPVQTSAFYAQFQRAHSLGRTFDLILDERNERRPLPPPTCLLSGITFAHTVVVLHTVNVGEALAALARRPSCDVLTKLVLAPVGDFTTAKRVLLPLRGQDGEIPIKAPNLKSVELRQMAVDFPKTFGLRHLLVDCRSGADLFVTYNAFRPQTLHAILARNKSLETVELRSPIGDSYLQDSDQSVAMIALLEVAKFKLTTSHVPVMAWILSRLTLSTQACISLEIGEYAKKDVDVPSLVRAMCEFSSAMTSSSASDFDALPSTARVLAEH
ncbi:unnamed protein product [Peniophora sp. CBMAI 1063]|nr:unnamed protein product [Peniophora sp. CBMAI 1063]